MKRMVRILVAVCLVTLSTILVRYGWLQKNLTWKPIAHVETTLRSRLSKSTTVDLKIFNSNETCFRYDKESKHLKHPEMLQRLNCSHRLPKALVIGVKKCGTYTLQTFLDLHPQVVTVAGTKYDPRASVDDWLETMPLSTPHQITISDFPGYIDVPEVLSHLKEVFIPDLKFILMLKDPVKRAQSDYDHLQETLHSNDPARHLARYRYDPKTSRNITVYRFYDILPTFDETITDPEGALNASHTLIKKGVYVNYVKNLFNFVPKETVLILDGGRFKKDPLTTLKKVEEFLELPKFFQKDHFYYSEKKGLYCANVKTRPDQHCMGKTKGRVHKELNPNISDQLNTFYREHNLQLQKFLNQTFSWI